MARKRGPRSASELSAVVALAPLPAPPAELTAFEASLWHKVVATKPSDWFSADSHELLIAYCKHAGTARLLDQELARFDPEWLRTEDGLERHRRLTASRLAESKVLIQLSRVMRLTQQSRYRAETAFTAHKATGSARKPWEFGGT